MELFVPGFEGERKRSTRPAMGAITAGTARACIHDLRSHDHFLDVQVLSAPHLYFLYSAPPKMGSRLNSISLFQFTNEADRLGPNSLG